MTETEAQERAAAWRVAGKREMAPGEKIVVRGRMKIKMREALLKYAELSRG
jgi:hypothetical protein